MGSDIYIKGEYMDTNIVMDFEKTVQYIMDKTGLSDFKMNKFYLLTSRKTTPMLTNFFPSIQTVTFVGINVHRFIWAKHAHHLPFLE